MTWIFRLPQIGQCRRSGKRSSAIASPRVQIRVGRGIAADAVPVAALVMRGRADQQAHRTRTLGDSSERGWSAARLDAPERVHQHLFTVLEHVFPFPENGGALRLGLEETHHGYLVFNVVARTQLSHCSRTLKGPITRASADLGMGMDGSCFR
jgi:hypothetical protein